ncbi:hypothetical protein [Bradyrhizobium sp. 145]|uniref:hypothetical protein n=1 Tax=Bradyrhizobium sp. 145 TaxID=2782621 RepID=UPI001FF954FE|nr:hypothetical protein [Bradyrhizobium sp. 145]
MARLVVLAAVAWCFSTSAWAQTKLVPPGAETAGSAVKQSNNKTTTRREATGKPAPVVGGPCDFGVVVTTGDEFTVLTTGLTVFQHKKTVVPIPGWGLNDLIFARIRATIPAGVSVLRIPYNPAKFPPPR